MADHRPVRDLKVGLFRDRVEGQCLAVLVFENKLRVEITLVLHDLGTVRTAPTIALDAQCLALYQVLEADTPRELGDDRRVVRVPSTQGIPHLDLLAIRHGHQGARRNAVQVDLAVTLIEQGN